MSETAFELGIGAAQRGIRVDDLDVASEIGDREQQISANFAGDALDGSLA